MFKRKREPITAPLKPKANLYVRKANMLLNAINDTIDPRIIAGDEPNISNIGRRKYGVPV